MDKKLQVFVSSTYTDLIEERQAAVAAILDAGHIPAGMELFKAGKSQMKTIQKWIDESDVYMLILGGRYGSIEEESGLSYTELEYRYALSKDMPVFAVVLSENFLTYKINNLGLSNVIEQFYPEKYKIFKKTVMSKIICKVDDKKDIITNIISTMNYLQQNNEYNLIGWIKSTTIKPINEFSEMFSDKITYQQLISILATTNACNSLIKFDDNTGEQKYIEDSPLYHANALDFFYAYYSLFGLHIKIDKYLYNNQNFFSHCGEVLVNYNLIIVTRCKGLIFTESSRKLYAKLILANYMPHIDLFSTLKVYASNKNYILVVKE